MGFIRRLLGWEGKSSDDDAAGAAAVGARYSRIDKSFSGVSVTKDVALGVATVLACTRVIANGVAQVPFRLYRDDGSTRKAATDHPLYGVIYRRPNKWQTSFEFRETVMFHLLLTGNAYVFVNRVGIARSVRELIPIDPGRVTVEQRADDSLIYKVNGKNGATQVFDADAVWHLRGPSWDSWRGLDAVHMARDAIGLSLTIEQSQAEFQRGGARVSGVLSVKDKLSAEQFEFLAAWLDRHAPGGDRAGKPIIADREAEFEPFTMTGADQQLIETRKHQIEEICRAFGVMPIMVGHADKTATYASAEQMFLAHVVHTLSPWYERLEQSADTHLLTEDDVAAGLYTKFTPNALMRGAAKDRADFYAKALGAGGSPAWMTQNEVRGLEELDKMDGADELPAASQAKPQGPQ